MYTKIEIGSRKCYERVGREHTGSFALSGENTHPTNEFEIIRVSSLRKVQRVRSEVKDVVTLERYRKKAQRDTRVEQSRVSLCKYSIVVFAR